MRPAWRSLWVQGVVVSAVAAVGVLAFERGAQAIPGGETRPGLSLRGNLSGVTGAQRLRFDFFTGSTSRCTANVDVTVDAAGDFEAELPTNDCPASLFDGSAVTYDVSLGATVLIARAAVNPVPYAHYAERAGVPECPLGYARDPGSTVQFRCTRSLAGGASDEVVRVGSGTSAFWIDRYEASLWENADGSGRQFGLVGPTRADGFTVATDHIAGFPDDASGGAVEYALSRTGVMPSRHTTQLQAMAACQASGKRLPSFRELYLAARGTVDPGVSDGSGGRCRTSSTVRATGEGTACRSAYGAEDLIGNVIEWTDQWVAGFRVPYENVWPDVSAENQSGNRNIYSFAGRFQGFLWRGIPSVITFGGSADDGSLAGRYLLSAYSAPISRTPVQGFRCVVSR